MLIFCRSDLYTMRTVSAVVDIEPIRKSSHMMSSVLHKTRDHRELHHHTLFSDTEEFTCSTPNMSTR